MRTNGALNKFIDSSLGHVAKIDTTVSDVTKDEWERLMCVIELHIGGIGRRCGVNEDRLEVSHAMNPVSEVKLSIIAPWRLFGILRWDMNTGEQRMYWRMGLERARHLRRA